jgi:hypothetical protein
VEQIWQGIDEPLRRGSTIEAASGDCKGGGGRNLGVRKNAKSHISQQLVEDSFPRRFLQQTTDSGEIKREEIVQGGHRVGRGSK